MPVNTMPVNIPDRLLETVNAPQIEPQIEPLGAKPRSWRWLPCRVGMRALGVLMLLTPLYEYVRFSPVYSTTECGDQVATVDNTGLFIRVTCWNPNPYRIQILTSERGKAYLGGGPDKDQLNQIGNLEVMPGMHLEEQGSGHVHIRINTQLPSLLPFLKDHETPLFMELNFDVGVQIPFGPFGVYTYHTSTHFKKACGLNIRMGRPGPLICKEEFAGMVPPHVTPQDLEPEAREDADGWGPVHKESMKFTAEQVDPDKIAAGEHLKNVGTLFVGLPTALLGLLLLLGLAEDPRAQVEEPETAGGGTPTGPGCGKVQRMLYSKVESPISISPKALERGFSLESAAAKLDSLSDLFRFVSCGRKVDGEDPLASPSSAVTSRTSGCMTSRKLFSSTTTATPQKDPNVSKDLEGYASMLPGLPAGLRAAASAAAAETQGSPSWHP